MRGGEPEMIDSLNRKMLARAIIDYLDCKISNFELDDILFEQLSFEDRIVLKIKNAVYMLYDDCSRHYNKNRHAVKGEKLILAENWIRLLASQVDDSAIPKDEPESIVDKFISLFRKQKQAEWRFFPFDTENEWDKLGIPFYARRHFADF